MSSFPQTQTLGLTQGLRSTLQTIAQTKSSQEGRQKTKSFTKDIQEQNKAILSLIANLFLLRQRMPLLLIFISLFFIKYFNNVIQALQVLALIKFIAGWSLLEKRLQYKTQLQYLMQKRAQCQCGTTVTIPNSECLYECRNCKEKGFFLCHIIPQPTDPMLVRCKTCKIAYSIFKCPQCQGTGVMKDFKSGQQYGCLCGFNATLITCNLCTVLLCLPPRKTYQNRKISCKKCNNQFKFVVCRDCKECNYFKATQNLQSAIRCFNQNCKSSNPSKLLQKPEPINRLPNKKWNSCRVCQTNEAVMLNSECMHLSICQLCYQGNRNINCPLCQGNGKQYFKVKIQ